MIEKYNKEDFDSICEWYDARGVECPKAHQLPSIGYIVPGVAAGFLYKTDSTICLIEGLISNPEAPTFKRSEAIDLVIAEILKEAERLGFDKIFGFTSYESVVTRVVRHGFMRDGIWHLVYKEII